MLDIYTSSKLGHAHSNRSKSVIKKYERLTWKSHFCPSFLVQDEEGWVRKQLGEAIPVSLLIGNKKAHSLALKKGLLEPWRSLAETTEDQRVKPH